MTAPGPVLRPVGGIKGWLLRQGLSLAPFAFAVLRRVRPILRLGQTYVVTRHDDVREVFGNDAAFGAPYKANIDVLTAGEPFFLGMADTPAYHQAVAAMRLVVLPEDLPLLAQQSEALADQRVAACGGRIDVVAGLVRPVTFDLFAAYFGIPSPAGARLDLWATRLFEFQFAGSPSDRALRAEVDVMAPALRAHIDATLARRKTDGSITPDVLGRCLALQAEGAPGFTDTQIRTALLCMIVGGPPQPPMVVPQAMEQLLRRPKALAMAQAAASADDDSRLFRIIREAMRFDPLAPALPRQVVRQVTLARGTRRATPMKPGARVLVGFASAMMDNRRLPDPARFDPDRRGHEYIHFGLGLHECFGRQINEATLHLMLKPLLRRTNLRRAAGPEGHLTKAGIFAERLVVTFDAGPDQTAATG